MLRARLSPAISSANAAAAAANSSLQARAREANAESNPPSEASTSAATTATATASAVATVEAPAVPAGPTLANIWEQPSEIISKMLSEVVKWPEPGTSFWETRPARAVEMPASPSNTDPTPRDTRPLNIVHVRTHLLSLETEPSTGLERLHSARFLRWVLMLIKLLYALLLQL